MNETFRQVGFVQVGQLSIACEEESVELPTAYDEGLPAPCVRLAIIHNSECHYCYRFSELKSIVDKIKFPVSVFCKSQSSEIAKILATFKGLPRPIVNSPLFEFIEESFDVKLEDVCPHFEDQDLIWHYFFGGRIKSVKFSTNTLQVTEVEGRE